MFSYCLISPLSASKSSLHWNYLGECLDRAELFCMKQHPHSDPASLCLLCLCSHSLPSFSPPSWVYGTQVLSWCRPTAGKDTLNKPCVLVHCNIWFVCVCKACALWLFKMIFHHWTMQMSWIKSHFLPKWLNMWYYSIVIIKSKTIKFSFDFYVSKSACRSFKRCRVCS